MGKAMTRKEMEAEADRLLEMDGYTDYVRSDEEEIKEGSYDVVSTKISWSVSRKLDMIAEKKGVSKYQIMQYVVNLIVRSLDSGTDITDDLRRAELAFGVNVDKLKDFCLANPSVSRDIYGAIYFFGDKGMKGMQPLFVDSPVCGRSVVSENVGAMIEMVIQYGNPALYNVLIGEKLRSGKDSVYQVLVDMVAEMVSHEDRQEIDLSLSDNKKNDYGREMAEAPYRRTMNRSDEFERRQMRMDF